LLEALALAFALVLVLATGVLKYRMLVGLRNGRHELVELTESRQAALQELQTLTGALSQVDLKERAAVRECRRLSAELKQARTRLRQIEAEAAAAEELNLEPADVTADAQQ
jgi:hypothetical protein